MMPKPQLRRQQFFEVDPTGIFRIVPRSHSVGRTVIEARPPIPHDHGDVLGPDPARDEGPRRWAVTAGPLDRVALHLQDGQPELLDLPCRHRCPLEQARQGPAELVDLHLSCSSNTRSASPPGGRPGPTITHR